MKLVRRAKRRPTVPMGTRLYVCGDIHGRLDLLEIVLDKMKADLVARPASSIVPVFLGDFIDRGPDSAKVIEQLRTMQTYHHAICLKGNHEAMLLRFLAEPTLLATWVSFGALPTLMSYDLAPSFQPSVEECFDLASALRRTLPADHLAFLTSLPLSHTCGDYFFVHAGIRPDVPLHHQTEQDLLWIREDFLDHERTHPKIVVHGHTPVLDPEVRSNRINVDTGAYATGKLTCLILENESIGFL